MTTTEILNKLHNVATNPRAMMDEYLSQGKKVCLVAPIFTPEEIIHSMGFVPMGAWGADMQINNAKQYFPAFICSIMQTILEVGMNGGFKGASAIVIPSLCDSLKCLGQNWKYAVKDIPFIPMTYPQNRKPAYGADFTLAGYKRVIADLESNCEASFAEDKLAESIKVYNEHNAVMREFAEVAATSAMITPSIRNDVFKSGTFMEKSEHTTLVKELIASLKAEVAEVKGKVKIVTTGILADSPALLDIFQDLNMHIVADDIAAESGQYMTDAPDADNAMTSMVMKYVNTNNTSVVYDPKKERVNAIVKLAQDKGADGVVFVLTKFCDPDEFDYPFIKRACEAANMPCVLVEVDRQMENMEQARTMLQTFVEML